MIDRGSYRGNTKCLRRQTHNRLLIEFATGAVELINNSTSLLAHSAREEMARIGLLLLFFSVSLHSEHVSALSDLIPKYSALLSDSCPLASGCHMLPSLPIHVKTLQSLTWGQGVGSVLHPVRHNMTLPFS